MSLGLNTQSNGGGDFDPWVKYDARAGRWFKMERSQGADGWRTDPVDITMNAIFVIDFANIEVGWINFSNQGPDYAMVKLGQSLPAQPSKDHRQGFKVSLFSDKNLGGVRVWSHNAKCVLGAIDQLHNDYVAAMESKQGKLPVVQMVSTTAVTTEGKDKDGRPVKSTNYAPVFQILQWVDRPAALTTVPAPQQIQQNTAPSNGVMPPYQQPEPQANGTAGGPLF